MLIATAKIRVHVRKHFQVRELAATHTLEQMRRVRMLEKQVAWEREGGFDRIDTITEIHKETLRRLHTGFDPGSVYAGIYNDRRPPTPEEFTLDMNVGVESLRMELLMSEQPPPQYDLPPRARRSPVPPPPESPLIVRPDMKEEIPLERAQLLGGEGKVVPNREYPALKSQPTGTRMEELEEPHPAMQQTDQRGIFPFQVDIDCFLHIDCTRIPEQGGALSFHADVEVNPETTTPQVTARQ